MGYQLLNKKIFHHRNVEENSRKYSTGAQLVGHNTWDVVRLYTKDVIDEKQDLNVGLFD